MSTENNRDRPVGVELREPVGLGLMVPVGAPRPCKGKGYG